MDPRQSIAIVSSNGSRDGWGGKHQKGSITIIMLNMTKKSHQHHLGVRSSWGWRSTPELQILFMEGRQDPPIMRLDTPALSLYSRSSNWQNQRQDINSVEEDCINLFYFHLIWILTTGSLSAKSTPACRRWGANTSCQVVVRSRDTEYQKGRLKGTSGG